jgi:hypothetical protein
MLSIGTSNNTVYTSLYGIIILIKRENERSVVQKVNRECVLVATHRENKTIDASAYFGPGGGGSQFEATHSPPLD